MAEIKSAYEMAMERFRDVEPDRNSIKKQDYLNTGKLLCTKKIQGEAVDISKEIEETSEEYRELVRSGVGKALLAQISLVSNEYEVNKIDVLKDIACEISPRHEQIAEVFGQFKQISQKYLEEKSLMVEQIQAQYTQMVQKQGGVDPNMMNAMQDKIKSFDSEYTPVLFQVKETLSQLCDIEE